MRDIPSIVIQHLYYIPLQLFFNKCLLSLPLMSFQPWTQVDMLLMQKSMTLAAREEHEELEETSVFLQAERPERSGELRGWAQTRRKGGNLGTSLVGLFVYSGLLNIYIYNKIIIPWYIFTKFIPFWFVSIILLNWYHLHGKISGKIPWIGSSQWPWMARKWDN